MARAGFLSVGEQAAAIRQAWPGFRCTISAGRLSCEGHLRPTNFSRQYRVRVRYAVGSPPEVSVVQPIVTPPPGLGAVPHTYPGTVLRPCVYFPDGKQWTARARLAVTVIPWLVEWLFYFELWLATGEWLGGGIAHGTEGGTND